MNAAKRLAGWGFAALTLVSPAFATAAAPKQQPVTAAPAPATSLSEMLVEAQRAKQETAMTFAKSYMPIDLIKMTALKSARQAYSSSWNNDIGSIALEKKYPGVLESTLTALDISVARIYDRELPNGQRAIADLARKYFTEPQMAQLIGFYTSPTGKAFLQAVSGAMDTRELSEKYRANPEMSLTGSDIRGLMRPEAIGQLTPDQIRELARFLASPVGLRMQRIAPILAGEVARSTNQLVSGGREEVQAATMQSIGDFIRQKAPRAK